MKTAGIIAEYNPFHKGHEYQIRYTKEKLKADYVIVAMSGDYVQRGTPALISKHARAEMALRCGADLVLEMPVSVSTSSAEAFAMGGVSLLDSLGIVDILCFGSESGEISALKELAEILVEEPEEYKKLLKSFLSEGLTFPAARSQALTEYFKNPRNFNGDDFDGVLTPLLNEVTQILNTPNNILGIEYCKAILRQGAAMQLLPLPRLGAAHGTAQTGQVQGQALASASHIRQLVHTQGIKAASPFVPQAAMELYRQAAEQGQLADPEKFSTAVLTLLRTKTPEQLSTLRGAGEGLENRLYAAAREAETVNDLYDRLKTKRYPTARLRRLVLDAVLDVPAAGLPALPPYLLVLGAKRSALPLLKHAKIPAGTSLAGLAGQDQKLQIAADMHSKAVDFSLLCRYKIQPMGHAYTAHVVLL